MEKLSKLCSFGRP